jgi:putative ABC transport system permease protein
VSRLGEQLHELWFRISNTVRRPAREAELREEMRFHREMLERDLAHAGLSAADAADVARRRFGNITSLGERSRDWWTLPTLDALSRDLKYAVRRLVHEPLFTIVVLVTLALGLGANITIFTVVDAVLLRPLPYADPARLVVVNHSYHSPQFTAESQVSAAGFRDYRERAASFAATAAEAPWDVDVRADGAAERIRAVRATSDFFTVLGVAPFLGRALVDDDAHAGRDRVVVLSHTYWQSAFGASPSVLGRSIDLDGEAYRVIGVMPADFVDPLWHEARAWTPLVFTASDLDPAHYTDENIDFVGRLKPTVSLAAARADMARIAETVRGKYPDRLSKDWTLSVTPLRDHDTVHVRAALLTLLGAVGFVLLIACANVASLVLARGAGRRRELALRTALGGGRAVILRQLLMENLLLALVGGALGLIVSQAAVRVLPAFVTQLPGASVLRVDRGVIVFSLLLVAVTAIGCGLGPAVEISSADVNEALRASNRTGAGDRAASRLRAALVVGEIALALVLVSGATLLVKSVLRLQAVNPGFDTRGLLTFKVSLPTATYRSDTARVRFFDDALRAMRDVPGVQGIAATNALPFDGNNWNANVAIEGYAPKSMSDMPWGDRRIVNAGYFATMRIPLIAGRYFRETDAASGAPVAIVDAQFATRYFPGQTAIGRRVSFGRVPGDTALAWSTIVGVVAHAAHEGLDARPRPQTYQPYEQYRGTLFGMEIAVRSALPSAAIVPGLRRSVQSIDVGVPIAAVHTMDDLVEESMGQRRLTMLLLEAFSLLALALAAIGIYGLVSYSIAQRTREIGIRRALGASSPRIIGLVVGYGVTLASAGVVLGLGGATALTRLLANQLYAVTPTDRTTFALAAILVMCTAVGMATIPAIRATRLDPLTVLRDE